MSYRYEHYIHHVTRQPWAILPAKLETLWDMMRMRAMGHRLTDEEIVARVAAEDDTARTVPPARSDGAIAVIPIVGTVAHRAESFEMSSGGTSTQVIGAFLRRAVQDESVKSILLDISSPGGSVEGVPELAAQIRAARDVKPVTAISNALAASAAYWLGSQASEFVITPSGQAGSIGVYMLLVDQTAYLEKEGLKVNAISAGEYKLEGAPWQELSDESRAFMQGQVDTVYALFLKDVAAGRGVTVAQVKKDFGGGRVFDAKQALERGMVDRIATFEDTLGRMAKARATIGRTRALRAEADSEAGVQGGELPGDPVEPIVAAEREAEAVPPAPGVPLDVDYRESTLAVAKARQEA